MALKKCPECGEEISSNALSCPKCGSSEIVKGCYAFIKTTLILFGAAIGFVALIALVGSIIKSRESKIKIIQPIEKKEVLGPVSDFSARDYPKGWPFTVESINVTCKKSKNGFWGILANTDGKTYSLNGAAKVWFNYPYPDEIIDLEGFNKLRKLAASKESWREYKPFTAEETLSNSDIQYAIGESPIGEALKKLCGG
tara:strand:- start:106 stop:699 length:594 start_codon:yes stop_codon:yes gene_type:complete